MENVLNNRYLIRSVLAESLVFRSISGELLDRLAAICTSYALEKGEYLFREGDLSKGFYIVHRGAMRVHKLSEEGTQLVLNIFCDGQSFGEATIFSFNRYPANACAECFTQLIRLPRVELQQLARESETILQCIDLAIARHLEDLVTRLEERTFLDPESRVASWIAREGGRGNYNARSSFVMNAPKRSVAEELDMTGETFSRKLRSLRERGVIEVAGRRIEIVDCLALQRLAKRSR